MRNRLLDLVRRTEREPEVSEEPQHERCLSCSADLDGSAEYDRFRVCHACGFHFHVTARDRVSMLLDQGSFREADSGHGA